jgi:membrane protein DedA with SNARE-associated domain
MQTVTHSVLWGITLSLFAGGLGVPVPENALVIAGGYAIYKGLCPAVVAVALWSTALILGDATLFLLMRWFFSRPSLSMLMKRLVKPDKLEQYKRAFSRHGGWTLFLARFTFGIRAVAYVAAGAADYPFRRFLAVDGVSVGLQILLFIGIGYYGSERIEWAKAAVHEIAILLTIFALLSILVSVAASLLIKQLSKRNPSSTRLIGPGGKA